MGLNSSTIEEWLSSPDVERSPETLRVHRRSATHFLNWANANNVFIAFASASDFDKYAIELKRTLPPTGISQGVSMLRLYYKWLFRNHARAYRNPMLAWKMDTSDVPTGPRGAFVIERETVELLTEHEVHAALQHAYSNVPGKEHGEEWTLHFRRLAIVETLYSTGMTAMELAQLTLSHLEHASNYLLVGQGGDQRPVPLTSSARAALRQWLVVAENMAQPAHHSVFFSFRNGKPLPGYSIARDVQSFGQTHMADRKSAFDATNLRNSFAAHLIARGANLELLAFVMGQTRMGYIFRVQEALVAREDEAIGAA